MGQLKEKFNVDTLLVIPANKGKMIVVIEKFTLEKLNSQIK
jgi:hypothetical protein